MGSTATKFDLCDAVKKEFREYQTYKAEEKKDEESHEKKGGYNICIGSMLMVCQTSSRQQINQVNSVQRQMITGMMLFTVSVKNFNNKNYLKNIKIIFAFLFLLIVGHGTYVLVWNNL